MKMGPRGLGKDYSFALLEGSLETQNNLMDETTVDTEKLQMYCDHNHFTQQIKYYIVISKDNESRILVIAQGYLKEFGFIKKQVNNNQQNFNAQCPFYSIQQEALILGSLLNL